MSRRASLVVDGSIASMTGQSWRDSSHDARVLPPPRAATAAATAAPAATTTAAWISDQVFNFSSSTTSGTISAMPATAAAA